MPIYEFRCGGCEKVFDLMVLPGDKLEMKCPECDCQELTKMMSAASHNLGRSNYKFKGGPGGVNHRSCGSGSCTTIDIPGRES